MSTVADPTNFPVPVHEAFRLQQLATEEYNRRLARFWQVALGPDWRREAQADLAVSCLHCQRMPADHTDKKCLFEPTYYTPLGKERAWLLERMRNGLVETWNHHYILEKFPHGDPRYR